MKRFFAFTGLVVVLMLWMNPLSHAQSSSNWLSPSLNLGQREDIVSGQLPDTIISAGNIPCTIRSFATRPSIPPLQTAQTTNACAVLTRLGWVAPGGYTDIFKTDAKLFANSGAPVSYYAIPGHVGGVVIENTAQGFRLHYYAGGLLSARKSYNSLTHELNIYLPANPSWSLKDKSGKPLYIRPESINFSNNGQWMVADSAFVATLIVNLASGEVIPFSAPYSYNQGLSVTPHLTVSDDGQTTVKSSDNGEFKITSISSCSAVPPIINGPVTCSSVSTDQLIRSNVNGYRRVYQPRFLNDRRLSLYVSSTVNGVAALTKFQLAPTGEALENLDYLAMGDSFASGEGAYDYFIETDTEANMCHLSKQSYPYLIGRQLNITTFNSVACSGARLADISQTAQKPKQPSPNNMGRWLPGYQPQLSYSREHSPTVITIEIGGNDVGFLTKLRACLSAGNCYPTYESRLEIVREMNQQFSRLVDAYSLTKQSTKSNARIYVVGYPKVVKEDGNCGVNVRLGNEEIIFANRLIDYFNLVLAQATKRAGVRYVDAADALAGRRLCESNEPLAFNGITLGNDSPLRFGPLGNESFHPNQLGHQLFKQQILEKTNNLTLAMPTPIPSAEAPSENEAASLLQVAKSNRSLNELSYDPAMTSDSFTKGDVMKIDVGSNSHFLKPLSNYKVEIHSSPLVLGSGITDNDGAIKSAFKLPDNLEPGFHILHLFASDIVGSSVDIYKDILIVGGSKAAPAAPATWSLASVQSNSGVTQPGWSSKVAGAAVTRQMDQTLPFSLPFSQTLAARSGADFRNSKLKPSLLNLIIIGLAVLTAAVLAFKFRGL